MGTQRWCVILSIFLALVKSESQIHDDSTESFYESQFSSPSPTPLSTPTPEAGGLKEVVLFLTPDQVQALQDAGALVRPYPELVNGYPKQDQHQRNFKIQNISEVTIAPKSNKRPNPGIDSYYMLFNIQEINDDLSLHPQTVEMTTKIPTTTPRPKYTKSRNRNKDKEYYAASNAKKSNRTKTINQNSNTEYVRFLPNYEKQNYLKMTPYRALPLIPYHTASAPANTFIPSTTRAWTNGRNSAHRFSTERNLTDKPPIISTQTARNEVTKSIPLMKANSPPLLPYSPVPQRQSKHKEFKEPLIPVENLPPQRKKQFQFETSVQAPTTVRPRSRLTQEQLALLLAPLYQHQTITEAISLLREESLSEEGKVKTSLPQLPEIKDAPQHNSQQYTTEKLTTNLEKHYTFAEVEPVSRPPPNYITISRTPNSRTPDSRIPKFQNIGDGPQRFTVPNEISKPAFSIPTSVLVRSEPFDLPTLHPVTLDITRTVSVQAPPRVAHSSSFDITRGIPAPVMKPFKFDMKNFVPIPPEQHVSPMTRSFFAEVEKPMMVPKAIPASLKLAFPESVPIQMPETLSIIRPIWEH